MSQRFTSDTTYAFGRWLHWLSAIIFIVMVVGTDIWAEYTNNNADREALYYWHISIGVLFLYLLFLRIGWVFVFPERRTHFEYRWQAAMARINHFGLYFLMVAVPLTGLISELAGDETIQIFGLLTLGGGEWLLSADLAYYSEETHLLLKWGVYALLGLHVLGALTHWLESRFKSSLSTGK